MDSTVTMAGSGVGVASLLLDSGETPSFSPGHFWYQSSIKGLSTLLPQMRVKVQAAHMFSTDTMQMCVGETCLHPVEMKILAPHPAFSISTLWGVGHLVTTRPGWKSTLPNWVIFEGTAVGSVFFFFSPMVLLSSC